MTAESKVAATTRAELIEDQVRAYRILVNEQVLDSFGHVSVRSPDDPGQFLMPTAMPPSLVTPDDIVTFSVETSQPLDARGRRVNGERYLHGEIYKARPDVNAVIHSHSQAILPLSIANVPLMPVVLQAGFLPPQTPNFEIRDVRPEGESGGQITDIPRARALAECLGEHPAALLRGHGNVVVGSSVRQAVVYACYIDVNARMQMQAMALGKVIPLDEAERFSPRDFDINRPWQNFLQKMLDDTQRARIDRRQFGLDHTQ
jgi:ribulose-5-phosphate 4-epimerase/fuculose-1-phosphate aldolase